MLVKTRGYIYKQYYFCVVSSSLTRVDSRLVCVAKRRSFYSARRAHTRDSTRVATRVHITIIERTPPFTNPIYTHVITAL